VLDRAHRGDIIGAFGRVASAGTGPPPTSRRRRLAILLAVTGPGVVVMVADNDAGGIATYAQAGQDSGLRYVWLLAALAVVLFVNQEMVARLGAVTGAGHARLILERFGRRWGMFALADLLVVNLLVLVTEFIGITLGLGYFGVSRYLSVPVAAVALVAAAGTGSFRRWERAMYALVTASLVAVPLLAVVRPHGAALVHVAAVRPGSSPGSVLVAVALIGTTVAPWQLFFQQSNVVDKRITARWISYERADTAIGTALFALGAIAVMTACAVAFSGTALHGAFADAGEVASALRARGGDWAGALFAVALVNGSVLGAGAVTLSTSYAIGDVTGTRHSLHRRWGDARTFHRSYAAFIAAAAVTVLIPGAPLGIVTIGVQALAGVLLPSALVFLLLLCNDRTVLGPWVSLPVHWPAAVTAGALAAGLGALAGIRLRSEPETAATDAAVSGRPTWTMPAIETRHSPPSSPATPATYRPRAGTLREDTPAQLMLAAC
jgi:Mn2+/Fe2+ NRAMP family transporter